MLHKSEKDEVNEVKKVAQTIAFFFAIAGVFLFLLTLVFAGELLGITSRSHENDGTLIGGLVSLLYTMGSFMGSFLGVLLFGGVTVLFLAQVYGLWHMKRWSLYVAAAATVLFFVFTLTALGDPSFAPVAGITSLLSGGILAYMYRFREHFR